MQRHTKGFGCNDMCSLDHPWVPETREHNDFCFECLNLLGSVLHACSSCHMSLFTCHMSNVALACSLHLLHSHKDAAPLLQSHINFTHRPAPYLWTSNPGEATGFDDCVPR